MVDRYATRRSPDLDAIFSENDTFVESARLGGAPHPAAGANVANVRNGWKVDIVFTSRVDPIGAKRYPDRGGLNAIHVRSSSGNSDRTIDRLRNRYRSNQRQFKSVIGQSKGVGSGKRQASAIAARGHATGTGLRDKRSTTFD
jgi:hypothetical protein